GWQNLTAEFDFAGAQRTAFARVSSPAEEKTYQLPHGVQAQAARHYRVFGKVAIKEPQVRADIELSNNLAFAICAAMVVDLDDTIHHQHIADRQSGVSRAKHLSITAGQQLFPVVRILGRKSCIHKRW